MKTSRAGMTLFELLIVMIIVGIVYSIGMFTIKKEKVTATTMNMSTLKTTLLALGQPREIRMFCDVTAQVCRVFSMDNKLLTTLHLQSNTTVQRYGFDRFGELKLLGNVVVRTEEGLEQGCFEMLLHPDGSVTPVILKNNNKFYAYTPMGEDKPYIARSEEELRNFFFNESLYPMRGDDSYGAH